MLHSAKALRWENGMLVFTRLHSWCVFLLLYHSIAADILGGAGMEIPRSETNGKEDSEIHSIDSAGESHPAL